MSSGVQVNAITKSGTNTPSGSFSGYFRSDKFNAADFITKEVLPYSDQQVSMTYGGPIVKDKFHSFGSFEYEREPQTYIYNTPYAYFNGSLTGTRTEEKGIARIDYQFSPHLRLSVRGSRYCGSRCRECGCSRYSSLQQPTPQRESPIRMVLVDTLPTDVNEKRGSPVVGVFWASRAAMRA